MLGRFASSLVLALAGMGAWASGAAAEPSPYPSTPFTLPEAPTAVSLPFAFGGPSEWGEPIAVAMRGRAITLVPRRDGSLVARARTTLPADVAPTAIGSSSALDFYLDASRSRVLVYPSDGARTAQVRTLAVGPQPSGLVAGDNAPDGSYVIAANAGDGTVSMYRSRHGMAFGAQRRIKVGARPSAILLYSIDDSIAVANTGSGTVSDFRSPESFDGFGRRPDVAVGGAPSALANADALVADLNYDVEDDLVVGDTTRGVVTQLRSIDHAPWFHRGPVFSTGPIDALAVANLDRDTHPDLAVSDRAGARVLILHGTRGNGFGPPTLAASGVDPVALIAGRFGGDYQHDLLVADARTHSVRLLLTPGDPVLSAGRPARDVVAVRGGRLLWSERIRRHRHRLVMWSAGSARLLPVRASDRPIVARTGRVRGHVAVAYVRCRRARCRPFTWDLERGREQRLRISLHRDCALRAVAVWNRTAAFQTRGCRASGLWITRRGGRARRVSATGELGALRGNRVVYRLEGGEATHIRMAGLRGRARTLDRFPSIGLSTPRIDGRYAYWTEFGAVEPLILVRTRIDRRSSCWEHWPRRDGTTIGLNGPGDPYDPSRADFTVRRDRLFYADNVGVFEVQPDRIRWRRACRR